MVACSGDGGIEVVDAWARPMAPVVEVGAIYVTVDNESSVADALTGASSTRCGAVQLHDTVLEESVMRMVELDTVDLEPGERLQMEPTGLHVMCLGVEEPFADGEELEVTLHFDRAGDVVSTVVVEER